MVRKKSFNVWMGVAAIALSCSAIPQIVLAESTKTTTTQISHAAYIDFKNDVSEIAELRLDQPKNVERAKSLLIRHDQVQLSRGFVLQMGQIAIQSSKFQQGVKKAARKRGGSDRLIARLQTNPYAVTEIKGWKNASKNVATEVARDSAMMNTVSHRLSEVAYGRTANEARYANEARAGSSGGITGAVKTPKIKQPNELMAHILAAGAIMSLEGKINGQSAAAQVAANAHNDQCLRWAHLNFRQCLAASRDSSERAYCLSQQGIGERSNCWAQSIGPAS